MGDRDAEILNRLDVLAELMQREFAEAKADRRNLAERISRLEGRIEEQSKVLQLALAGRLPRTSAAE